jgi:NADPH:quinone reductase-like Zn-dependent oxidoreductase
VRLAATSLNFTTFLQAQAKYQERPPLPFVPRSDYSGVAWLTQYGPACLGSFAEQILAEEK